MLARALPEVPVAFLFERAAGRAAARRRARAPATTACVDAAARSRASRSRAGGQRLDRERRRARARSSPQAGVDGIITDDVAVRGALHVIFGNHGSDEASERQRDRRRSEAGRISLGRFERFVKVVADTQTAWGRGTMAGRYTRTTQELRSFRVAAREYAEASRLDEWADYEPTAITLDDLRADCYPNCAWTVRIPASDAPAVAE